MCKEKSAIPEKERMADVRHDVLVLGSCIMDFTCYSNRLPKRGETIKGKKFETGYGGKGANQCVTAARLGSKTALIAKLGADPFGDNYREHLRQENVNTDQVKSVEGQTTGIAQINVADNGDNQIVIVVGANDTMTLEDVDNSREFIDNAKVMVCQMETPARPTLAALKLFKGISILNPSPPPEVNSMDIFTVPNILCVNEHEAASLTHRSVPNLTEAKRAVNNFMCLGVRCVIITLGALGAIFASNDDPKPIHVRAPKCERVIDTTGAGDAFIGALAHYTAIDPTIPLVQRVGAAVHIATYSVQRKGTQTSYPTLQDLGDFDVKTKKFDWSYV